MTNTTLLDLPYFFRLFLAKVLFKKILPTRYYEKHIGRHEHGSLRLWQQIVSRLNPGAAILDIGAFQGEYAIAARQANQLANIYSFEPNPHSRAILQNKCAGLNIQVEEYAVAEKSGFVSFALSSATSHIDHSESPAWEETLQVPTVSLDDWASGKNFLVALAKIDVEGAETMVLRGAIHLLRTHQSLILCEVLTDEAGVEVMDALPPEYHYYHIDENTGLSARKVVDRKLWRNKNWLFVPKSKQTLLAGLI